VDCVFIGYDVNSNACRFLVHKSVNLEIHVNTVIESDNTEFFEHIYLYKTECESTTKRPKQPRKESTENILPNEDPRRSNMIKRYSCVDNINHHSIHNISPSIITYH